MGRVKQEWMEAEERGYSLPDRGKYVCASHFEDTYLQEYINENSVAGECTYCKKKSKVIDLRDLMAYVCEKITAYYGNPDNEGLYLSSSYYDDEKEEIPGFKRVGLYIVPEYVENYEDSRDLLCDLGLCTGVDSLNSDIEACFLQDAWIRQNVGCLTESEELSLLWNSFSRMVKHERRFTFFRKPEFMRKSPSGDNGLFDVLTELEVRIKSLDLIKKIEVGRTLYRCRFIDEQEIVDSFNKITSAPAKKAKQSRMSPAGVSMFYGNFDQKTAIKEASSDGGDITERHAVGEFVIKRALNVLDLTCLPDYSFWMQGDREGVAFLHAFNREITKQIARDNNVHVDYIPSQVFTEYVKCICKHKGKPIDGIVYASSLLGSNGKNIVLFYDQYKSSQVLELKSLKIV